MCLKKAKLNFLIFKQVICLRKSKSYGNALLVFFNTDKNFYLSKQLIINSFLSFSLQNSVLEKQVDETLILAFQKKIFFYKAQDINF